jgi:hypothetical protein
VWAIDGEGTPSFRRRTWLLSWQCVVTLACIRLMLYKNSLALSLAASYYSNFFGHVDRLFFSALQIPTFQIDLWRHLGDAIFFCKLFSSGEELCGLFLVIQIIIFILRDRLDSKLI